MWQGKCARITAIKRCSAGSKPAMKCRARAGIALQVPCCIVAWLHRPLVLHSSAIVQELPGAAAAGG